MRVPPVVAFLGDKRSSSQSSKVSSKGRAASSSTKQSNSKKNQPVVPALGKPPTNARENAESVLWFVAIAGFFMTGVCTSKERTSSQQCIH